MTLLRSGSKTRRCVCMTPTVYRELWLVLHGAGNMAAKSYSCFTHTVMQCGLYLETKAKINKTVFFSISAFFSSFLKALKLSCLSSSTSPPLPSIFRRKCVFILILVPYQKGISVILGLYEYWLNSLFVWSMFVGLSIYVFLLQMVAANHRREKSAGNVFHT